MRRTTLIAVTLHALKDHRLFVNGSKPTGKHSFDTVQACSFCITNEQLQWLADLNIVLGMSPVPLGIKITKLKLSGCMCVMCDVWRGREDSPTACA